MKRIDKIGLAMYTVHEEIQKNMEATFEKAVSLGVRGIEFYGKLEAFRPEQVVNALHSTGLVMTGWHLDWGRLHDEFFYDTVEYLQKCGCTMAVIQCLGGKWNIGHDRSGECRDRWLYYAEWMNRINEKLRKEGLRLGYHNHEHEFALHYDEKTVYDILYGEFDGSIIMELDSGNCIEGGGNPVSVLEKYKERELILHLKPYSIQKGFDVILGEEGDANNWKELLEKGADRCRWLLLESENTALPEMENVEKCFQGLKRYLK